jgi:hypothetical protein
MKFLLQFEITPEGLEYLKAFLKKMVQVIIYLVMGAHIFSEL